ncbi:hypothetical protein NPIL_497911, partial [Nephila pilipes]
QWERRLAFHHYITCKSFCVLYTGADEIRELIRLREAHAHWANKLIVASDKDEKECIHSHTELGKVFIALHAAKTSQVPLFKILINEVAYDGKLEK